MADSTRRALLILQAKDEMSRTLKGAGDEVDKTGKSLLNLGTIAAGAAVAGVGLFVAGLKASIDAAMEAERVTAQTEAVIKATGGAAGLTAEQIGKLAESESRLTSIDDEVIQSGANMLLTFKEIGGDTFPRATRAMEDMAVAMAAGDTSAIDLKGTAIQLGKALNDPVKGMSALQRVGVTFSQSQKDTIKEMVRMNDVAGAQAVILSELESEFGGAAEAAGNTTAGAMAKLSNEVGNAFEAIGTHLLPVVRDLATGLTNLVTAGKFASDVLRTGAEEALESATSYESYRAALDLLIEAKKKEFGWSNLSIDANGDLVRTYEDLFGSYSKVIVANFALTEAEKESIRIGESWADITDRAADSARGYAEKLTEVISPTDDLTDSQEELKAQMSSLRFLMGGIVGNEMTAYQTKQDELIAKSEELRAELEKLEGGHGRAVTVQQKNTLSAAELNLATIKLAEAQTKLAETTDPKKQAELAVQIEKLTEKMGGATEATTSYVDNSKKMAEVESQLAELDAAYLQNAAAHESATKRILFDIASQQLAMDGLTTTEVEALTALASQWGLMEEATARAVGDVLIATTRLAEDENINTFQADMEKALGRTSGDLGQVEEQARRAQGAIDRMQGKEIIITSIFRELHEQGQGGPGGRQHGGPVTAGVPYTVNELGRGGEFLISALNGFVLNRQQAMQAMSGAGGGAMGGGGMNTELLVLMRSLPQAMARAVRDGVQLAR